MNKFKKLAKCLAMGMAVTLAGSMLGGCQYIEQILGGQPSGTSSSSVEEIEYPETLYTVTEEFISAKQANDAAFKVASVEKREESPLAGKTLYWLGSSVTYGSASGGESMADYLAALTGCISKKDAVSGTTIFDDNLTENTGAKSYTRRLVNSTVFDKEEQVDAFICQISTNDARNDRLGKRGFMTGIDFDTSDAFDKTTTLGGVEFIITYVTETWGCPVYFYSGSYFGDTGTRKNSNPKGSEYAKLIDQVREIAEKYNGIEGFEVGIIDLYNDEAFNAVASDKYYSWVMSDSIHPKAAGYLQWWTPYFESYLAYEMMLRD